MARDNTESCWMVVYWLGVEHYVAHMNLLSFQGRVYPWYCSHGLQGSPLPSPNLSVDIVKYLLILVDLMGSLFRRYDPRFHPLCKLIYHKVLFLCTFFATTAVALRMVTRTISKQPLSCSVQSGTKSWPVVSAVACFVLPSFETQGVYTHTNVAWSCSLRTEVCNCLYCRSCVRIEVEELNCRYKSCESVSVN